MAMPGLSPAGAALGLGGQLAGQVAGESDEEKKRRMAQIQQQKLMGPGASLAVTSLFGMNGGAGAGYQS